MENGRKVLVSVKVSTLLLILLIIVVVIVAIVVVKNNNNLKEETSDSLVVTNTEDNTTSLKGFNFDTTEEVDEEENLNVEETDEDESSEENTIIDVTSITSRSLTTRASEDTISFPEIEVEVEEEPVPETTKIEDVTISKDMDLTVTTGLSREDFITLMTNLSVDTSGFFEQNAGTIYDVCQEYSLNEVFYVGLISAESGWTIAQNHRNTYNYISLMGSNGLIRFNSVEDGLTRQAQTLHERYLSEGGSCYYGKTLEAMKTRFCPGSSTWVNLVYGRMEQVLK